MAQVYRKPFKKGGKKMYRKKWYIRFRDPNGKRHDVPGYTDKKATEALAIKLQRRADLLHSGISDPSEEHAETHLDQHLEDFKNSLVAKGTSSKQIDMVYKRARRIIKDCKFQYTYQITPGAVQNLLAELKKPIKEDGVIVKLGLAQQTINFYLRSIQQFIIWMVKNHRMRFNPLSGLQGGNVRLDRRHDRRALTHSEITKLLTATYSSKSRFRKLNGKERALLYQLALCTGFRVSELASLIPEDFHLDGKHPSIRLSAGSAKNRHEAVQPIPTIMVEPLRKFLAKRRRSFPVWPGPWHTKAAKMLRADLKQAGVVYKTEEGFADFHALRHTFITITVNSGAKPKLAQELARHSDIRLTMNRYAHTVLEEKSQAVATLALPWCLPQCHPKRETQGDNQGRNGTVEHDVQSASNLKESA